MENPQCENGYTKIANEIMEKLAKIRIPGEAYQILNVILRKTYGFNKKYDKISISQFHKATNIKKPSIIRAIKLLQSMNLITISKKANANLPTYGFIKHYSQWKPISKKANVSNKVNGVSNKAKKRLPKSNPQKKKETIQKKDISDKDFINLLKDNPAYKGINIDRELAKMDAWFLTPKGKGRKKTRRFIVNWLNKIDKPIESEEEDDGFVNC